VLESKERKIIMELTSGDWDFNRERSQRLLLEPKLSPEKGGKTEVSLREGKQRGARFLYRRTIRPTGAVIQNRSRLMKDPHRGSENPRTEKRPSGKGNNVSKE